MRKRSYILPFLFIAILILGTVFLVSILSKDPYDKAMNAGNQAMTKKDYTTAVSQYTIAQSLRENEKEPYIKALEAMAYSNNSTVVRDILSTVNNCIHYCGEDSLSPEYIIEIMDILISNENGKAAYDILNHIHNALAEDDAIKNKLAELAVYDPDYVPSQTDTEVVDTVVNPIPQPIPDPLTPEATYTPQVIPEPVYTPDTTPTEPTPSPTASPDVSDSAVSPESEAPSPTPDTSQTPESTPAATPSSDEN